MPNNSEERERCQAAIYSDEYYDFIVDYSITPEEIGSKLNAVCYQKVTDRYQVLYGTATEFNRNERFDLPYRSIPKLFGTMDQTALESTGVLRLRRLPYLDLLGQDVIFGVVDTGIDYQNSLFINADNTSRIGVIWDQTIEDGPNPEEFFYGAVFTREQINNALQSETPQDIVPTIDEEGHGTFITGIAAGNDDVTNDFSGVAPLCDIAVVKLKPAKQNLRDFYGIQPNVAAFQENDIMMGVEFLLNYARTEGKPISICIGLGSNSGGHTGSLPLSEFLKSRAGLSGTCISVAAGNEGNSGSHYSGKVNFGAYEDVEIKVASNEVGLSVELWGNAPSTFSIAVISPSGEIAERIPPRYNINTEVRFLLEPTVVNITYRTIEIGSGDTLVFMKFTNPVEGVWRIRVFNDSTSVGTDYNMWLPISQFKSSDTYFLRPDPYTTLVETANAQDVLTVSTYNHTNNSIWANASRGYTRDGMIKPDITAPGVNVYGPIGRNQFGNRTGSSIAASYAAGTAMTFLQWGIVNGNQPSMETINIKTLFVKGANRSSINYPNREWGYGTLDVYTSFESLRTTV